MRFVRFLKYPAIIIVIAAFVVPGLLSSHRASNESEASTALQLLITAEADFRANDRDGNGVNDFWTGDVAGLYRFGLIERGLAEADVAPLNPLVKKPIPSHGYYFVALERDDSEIPPAEYQQVTDNKSGKVHHLTKFGFFAYPSDPGASGKYMYMTNENNSIFRAVDSLPHPKNWFDTDERRRRWHLPQ
jgi:type II secretory pathway pseudopilin PulG